MGRKKDVGNDTGSDRTRHGGRVAGRVGAGTGFNEEGEDFKTIRDHFDKLKKLIAIREEAEAGGSIQFSEESRREIARMASRDGAGIVSEPTAAEAVVEMAPLEDDENSAKSENQDNKRAESDHEK